MREIIDRAAVSAAEPAPIAGRRRRCDQERYARGDLKPGEPPTRRRRLRRLFGDSKPDRGCEAFELLLRAPRVAEGYAHRMGRDPRSRCRIGTRSKFRNLKVRTRRCRVWTDTVQWVLHSSSEGGGDEPCRGCATRHRCAVNVLARRCDSCRFLRDYSAAAAELLTAQCEICGSDGLRAAKDTTLANASDQVV